jgi:hypothetical protein
MKPSSIPTWRWWVPRTARLTPATATLRAKAAATLATADATSRGPVGMNAEPTDWQVLLNYRQADEPYSVAAMYEMLAGRFGPERIFRDCRSLRPGEDYTRLIMDVIRQAQVLVVVIGPRWLEITDRTGHPALYGPRDWVRREIDLALRLRKHVVPVLLEGVVMPAQHELPRDIAVLSPFQPDLAGGRGVSMPLMW